MILQTALPHKKKLPAFTPTAFLISLHGSLVADLLGCDLVELAVLCEEGTDGFREVTTVIAKIVNDSFRVLSFFLEC